MNITERFAQELCKDENIREAFIREGLIEKHPAIRVPIHIIEEFKDDKELGSLVRMMAEKF